MCLTRSSLCPKTGVMLESVASTIVWLPRVSRSGSPVRGRSICVTTELRVWSMGSVATWMCQKRPHMCQKRPHMCQKRPNRVAGVVDGFRGHLDVEIRYVCICRADEASDEIRVIGICDVAQQHFFLFFTEQTRQATRSGSLEFATWRSSTSASR